MRCSLGFLSRRRSKENHRIISDNQRAMRIRFIESDEMPKMKKIKKGEESSGDDGTTVISGADLNSSDDGEFVGSVSGAYLKSADDGEFGGSVSGANLKSTDDAEFVDAYLRSRPYFFVIPHFGPNKNDNYIKDIYCVPIGDSLSVPHFNLSDMAEEQSRIYDHYTISGKPTEQERIYDYTDIIDGIFCYNSKNRVFLANIFTHEILELPPIPTPSRFSKCYPRYYLGFDPVGGVYKLLCKINVWLPTYDHPRGLLNDCRVYILTLGRDLSWRQLLCYAFTLLPFLFTGQSMCINGVLYWVHKEQDCFMDIDSSLDKFKMYSFNLNEEKFVKTSTPVFTRDQNVLEFGCFLQFKGRLSLCACGSKKMVLYILTKDNKRWKRKVVVLPIGFWGECGFHYTSILAGNMPNGDIFFVNHGDPTSVYSYIYKIDSNTFERCVVGKWPWIFAKGRGEKKKLCSIACVEQNIATLDALNLGVYKTSYPTSKSVKETEVYTDYYKPPLPWYEPRWLARFDAITPSLIQGGSNI